MRLAMNAIIKLYRKAPKDFRGFYGYMEASL